MADNNLKMTLDVDVDLNKGRINDTVLRKAIAAVLRDLKLPKAQIKQEIGLTTTVPREDLRRQIDKHIQDLDVEIERGVKKRKGPGKGLEVDEGLTKQAQGLRRVYEGLSKSLAETTIPEDLLQDKSLKQLVDNIQRGNLDLDKVKSLSDEQLRKLRQYQASLRETAKIYSSIASLSRNLGVGLGVDPDAVPQVTTAARGLNERAKNLDIAIDPSRQEQRARREARQAQKARKESEDAQDDLERRQAELETRRRAQRLLKPFRSTADPLAAVQKLDKSLESPFDVDTLRRFFREEPKRLAQQVEQRTQGKTVTEQRSDTQLKELIAQYDRLRNESKLVEERLRALGKTVDKTASQLGRERDRRNEVALRRARDVQAQGLISGAGGLRNLRSIQDPSDQRLVRASLEDRRDRLQNVLDTRRLRGGSEANLQRTAQDLESVTKALNGVDPKRIAAAEAAREKAEDRQRKDAQAARREQDKLRTQERKHEQQREKSLERRVKRTREVSKEDLQLSDRQRARVLLAPVRRAQTSEEADRRLGRVLGTPADRTTVEAGLRGQLQEVDRLRRERSVGLTETQRAQRPDIQGLDREFDRLTADLEQVRRKLRELGATTGKTAAQLRKERERRVELGQRRERDLAASRIIGQTGGLRQVSARAIPAPQDQRLVQGFLQDRQARLQNVLDTRRVRGGTEENLRRTEDELKRISRALGRIDASEIEKARKESDQAERKRIKEQASLREAANSKEAAYEKGRDTRAGRRLKESQASERARLQQGEAQRILRQARRGTTSEAELTGRLGERFRASPADQAIFQSGVAGRIKELEPLITQRRGQLNAVQQRRDPTLLALESEFRDLTSALKAGKQAARELGTAASQAAKETARKTALDEKQRQLDKEGLLQQDTARARLTEGRRIVDAAGGMGNVTGIRDPEEQLIARDFLQNRQNTLRESQGDLLRRGLRDSPDYRTGHQDLTRTSKALDALNSKMSQFTSVGHQAGLTIRQFFRYAIGYGALYQVLAAVTALVGGLKDLNRELKSIQAVSTATNVEMLKVSAAIKTVALETKFTNTEIAQAAKTLAQAGVTPDQIQPALAATANFAAATESQLQVAADLVSSMRNVFRDMSDATIANQLTAAINQSKLTADDLKTIVSISAQINKSYGLSSEQFLAAATTLRNAGLKASTVATGLRQGLVEIFSPDAKTIKSLKLRYKELGEQISEEAIRTRFLGFRNAANPLVAALQELDRLGFTGGGKATFQRAFDIRAENAISALIGRLDELDRAESSLASGNSAIIGSQIQLTSLQATVDNLAAAFTVLADSIAGSSLDSLQKFLAQVVQVTREITELNENLKETAGFGFGTSVLAGLGVGSGVYANAKGGFVKRALLGGAAAAGTTAGFSSVAAPAGERGVDVNGIVNAVLTTAAITSVVAAVARRIPGIGRLTAPKVTAPVVAPTTQRVTATAAQSKAPGTVGKAATAVNGAALAAGLASMFSSLWERVKGIKGVAGFLVRRIPIVAIASVIGTMIALLDGFSFLSKEERSRRRIQQGLKNLTSGNQEFVQLQEEASSFRLSSPDRKAATGTEASELEDIGSRLSLVKGEIEQFFGRETEQLDQALKDLAKEGSEAGSGARRRALSNLSKQLGGDTQAAVEALSTATGTLTDDQAQTDRRISELATGYNGLAERQSQLRESLARTVLRLRDLGDQTTDAQRALVDAYTQVDNEAYGELSSDLELAPERVGELIKKVFEIATKTFDDVEDKLRTERLKDLKEETQALVRAGNLKNKDELRQFALSLAGEYRQLGFTFEEFIKALRDAIAEANRETQEEITRVRNAVTSKGSSTGRFRNREADRAESGGRFTQLLDDLITPQEDRGSATGRFRNRTQQDSADQPPADVNVNVQLEGPPEDTRTPTAIALEEVARQLELGQIERADRELKDQQTKVLNRLDDLIRVLQTPEGQQVLPEQSPDVQQQLDLDRLKALQNDPSQLFGDDGKPTEDLFSIGRNNFFDRAEDLIEHNNRLAAKNADALRDLGISASAAASRRKLESRTAQLDRKYTVADEQSDFDELRRIVRERQNAQLQLLQVDLKELRAQLAVATGDDHIVKRAQLSTQIVAAESKIAEAKQQQLFEEQRLLNELRLREADQRIASIQADIGLIEAQGGSGLPPRLQGYREGIGREQTPEQHRSEILNDITIAQKQQQQLQINIEKATNDTALGEEKRRNLLKDIKAQLIEQQYLIGKLQGEYDRLNADPAAQLKIAFDFDAIGERLRNLDGGFHTLGATLQNTLVQGVSDLGNGLAEAVIQGENLEDVLKSLLHTLANDIRLEIQKRVINRFLGNLFDAASGTKDPSGGAAGAASTAADLVSSGSGGGGSFFGKLFGGGGGGGGATEAGPGAGTTGSAGAGGGGFLSSLFSGFTSLFGGGGGAAAGAEGAAGAGGGGFLSSLFSGFTSLFGGGGGAAGAGAGAAGAGAGLGAILGPLGAGLASFGLLAKGIISSPLTGLLSLFGVGGERKGFASIVPQLFGKMFGLFSRGGARVGESGKIHGPGTGTSDEILGQVLDDTGRPKGVIAVSSGESILTRKATDALGEDFINQINSQGGLPKFAVGGMIRDAYSTTRTARTGSALMTDSINRNTNQVISKADRPIDLTTVNVVDESMFDQYVEGGQGRRTYMNFIKRNATSIKRILGS